MKKAFITKEQVDEIVKSYPTPFHIYDEKGIRENAKAVQEALNDSGIEADFKEYLEENYPEFYNNLDNFRFCKDSRSFGIELLAEQYINNYITSLYYDIQDNTDNYAEHLNVENKIFEILKNYFENT